MIRVVIVFFVAFLFCSEKNIHTFKNNINEGYSVKYKQDNIMTFEIPGMGEVRQGGNRVQHLEYLGKQGEFFLVRSTLSKITSINVLGGKVKSDYDSQIINNIPCLLYIDMNGDIDHLEAEQEYMEDIFKTEYMSLSIANYIYPFGKNAVDVSIGDSWIEAKDSIPIFLDDSGAESKMSISSTYTLDKIKNKKGINIAYISEISTVNCEFIMSINGEYMEGLQTGTFNSAYRFDIDNGELIRDSTSGKTLGELTWTDVSFTTHTYFSSSVKKMK